MTSLIPSRKRPSRRQLLARLDRSERSTAALAAGSLLAGSALVAVEGARILAHRRRRKALEGQPAETLHEVALEAAHEAHVRVQNAAQELQAGVGNLPQRDITIFNLTASYLISSALARGIAYSLRSRKNVGPFRNAKISGVHVHHFVPGVALVVASGAGALLTDNPRARGLLAIPFGTGLGLAVDESALWLRLDDVYWSREGLVGFQLTYGTLAALTGVGLARRLRRAGRRELTAGA